MLRSALPVPRTGSPTGGAIEPTPSFGPEKINGTTTPFTSRLRSFAGKQWLLWYNGRKGGVEQIGLAFHQGED